MKKLALLIFLSAASIGGFSQGTTVTDSVISYGGIHFPDTSGITNLSDPSDDYDAVNLKTLVDYTGTLTGGISNQLMEGSVIWDSLLYFTVTDCEYYIQGTFYTSSVTQIQLDDSHVTLNRLDVIGVDTNGAAFKITGTPAADPATPVIDPLSQLGLSIILVEAGATEPVIDTELVYDENVEWTTSSVATSNITVDFDNATDPKVGSKCIKISHDLGASISGGNAAFTDASTNEIADKTLTFYLKTSGEWKSRSQLSFSIVNGTSRITAFVMSKRTSMYGFDDTKTTWQRVSVNLDALPVIGAGEFDKITIYALNRWNNGVVIYFDYIELQSIITPPQTEYYLLTNNDLLRSSFGVPGNDVANIEQAGIFRIVSTTSSMPSAGVVGSMFVSRLTDGSFQYLFMDSSDNSLWVSSDAGTTWAQAGGASSSGLEKITESGQTGWRLTDMDPLNYGDIGDSAVDLSTSTEVTNVNGATGKYSLVAGYNTKGGDYSLVAGNGNSAGKGDVVFGTNNSTSSNGTTGKNNLISGEDISLGVASINSIVVGNTMLITSNLKNSIIVGRNYGVGSYLASFGYLNTGYSYSMVAGRQCVVSGAYSIAVGYKCKALSTYSTVFGSNSEAGSYSLAVGNLVKATGAGSFGVGYNVKLPSSYSLGVGYYIETNADYAFVMGSGINDKILETNAENTFTFSTARGKDAINDGQYSSMLGGVDNNISSSAYMSTILGDSNITATQRKMVYIPALKFKELIQDSIDAMSPENGTVVWNVDEKDNQLYDGSEWHNVTTAPEFYNMSINVDGVTSTKYIWLGEQRTESSGATGDYATDFSLDNQHLYLYVNSITGTGVVTITGTSISESSGVPTTSDTETITLDASTSQYWQTDKKWLEITNIDIPAGVTAINYDIGVVGYLDMFNIDFKITGLRVDMQSSGVNSNLSIRIIKIQDDGGKKMSVVDIEHLGMNANTGVYTDDLRTGGDDRSYTYTSTAWASGENFVMKVGDYDTYFSSDENILEGSDKAEGIIIVLEGTGGGNINNVENLSMNIEYQRMNN